MFHVKLRNLKTKEKFVKDFDNYGPWRKFVIKCRYSKKLEVLNYWCDDSYLKVDF